MVNPPQEKDEGEEKKGAAPKDGNPPQEKGGGRGGERGGRDPRGGRKASGKKERGDNPRSIAPVVGRLRRSKISCLRTRMVSVKAAGSQSNWRKT